jgi:predicted dehydrogenase
MSELRFVIIGTGFWARFQLAAWQEFRDVKCVALYNRTMSRAETLANEFHIPAVYDDAEKLLEEINPDFIDIITGVDTHSNFVHLAAKYRIPVICQKPMASSLKEAEEMVEVCEKAKIPFFVHDNWRWQTPIREVKKTLESGTIGKPFRARIQFTCNFPVYENQPFLRDIEQFIIADIGSHILDTTRFLFGEAVALTCQTNRIGDIKGEDVATIMLQMEGGMTVICDMSYASRTEVERFPQTFLFIEGENGSIELSTDYWIHCTTTSGTSLRRCPPPRYSWADPAYDVVHSSIVPCNANLLNAMQTGSLAETHARDNLRTVNLVFASYESAEKGQTIYLKDWRE